MGHLLLTKVAEFFAESPDIICLIDTSDMIVVANRTAIALWGSECVGKPFDLYLAESPGGDHPHRKRPPEGVNERLMYRRQDGKSEPVLVSWHTVAIATHAGELLKPHVLVIAKSIRAEYDREAELRRKNVELAALAVTDPLTGLGNRRALDAQLRIEAARSRRFDAPLSVCFIDLDGFKRVNDELGHAAGDQVLRVVGTVIRLALDDATDFPYRYGGDEFVVVLPHRPKPEALGAAERLRDAIDGQVFERSRDRRSLSASIGVATMQPSRVTGHTDVAAAPSERIATGVALCEAADTAARLAKQHGKSRVLHFDDLAVRREFRV